MVRLSGKFIAAHVPNEPGWWAYRKLSNGTLLRVELTKTEWFQLHEKFRQKELDKIRDLSKHPLNVAALTLIKQAHEYPLPNEIALISLARFALDEDVPNWDDRLTALSSWGFSPSTMQKAIWVLEEEQVSAEDLLSMTFKEAAELVFEHLAH